MSEELSVESVQAEVDVLRKNAQELRQNHPDSGPISKAVDRIEQNLLQKEGEDLKVWRQRARSTKDMIRAAKLFIR